MPIDYTIRESSRAKHVSLKISFTGALEVIVPQGFDQRRVPEILQQKQPWIDRVLRRMATRQMVMADAPATERPEQLELRAIAQVWQVDYCATRLPGLRITEQAHQRLVVSGEVENRDLCRSALRQWVIQTARLHLPPWLRTASQELGLPFNQVTIRRQKTLWGSCSARQSISLNCKLLFLPKNLVQYVLLHELCHTVHLNHSSDFWALVASNEPNYRQLDASLREAHYHVPRWMDDR